MLVLSFGLLPFLGASAPAVVPVAFEDLVLGADYVVRGEVVETLRIRPDGSAVADGEEAGGPYLEIAAIEVGELLRGPEGLATVWVHAQRTWTCDVTSAEVGEEALWFVHATVEPPGFGRVHLGPDGSFQGPEPPDERVRASIARLTGGRYVHRVAWSGRGKMPLGDHEGATWITARDEVVPPSEGDFLPEAHDGDYRRIYWTARLDEARRWVLEALERRDWSLPLDPRTGAPAVEAVLLDGHVVLAAWRDGTLVWSENRLVGGPPFGQGRVSDEERAELADWLYGRKREREETAAPLPPRPGPLAAVVRSGGVIERAVLARGAERSSGGCAAQLVRRLLAWIPEEGGGPSSLDVRAFETFPH